MSLITLDEFKSLLGSDVKHLHITGVNDFAPIELSASQIVANKTGLDIPVLPADAPTWCKLPTALICQWVAVQRNKAQISDKVLEDSNVKYKAAIDILLDNKIKSSKGVVRSGEIVEAYSW